MYTNQFSVRVVGGSEVDGGYVEISHGQQYSLQLRNDRDVSCDAKVEIDGKYIGTFRLGARDGMTLERSLDDDGRFTAYLAGTQDGDKAGLAPGHPDNGLIRVTFTPERKFEPRPVYHGSAWDSAWHNEDGVRGGMYKTTACSYSGAMPACRSEMGTGLSGHSGQRFVSVGALDYDYSGQTVIHLRLVGRKYASDGPRPLVPHTTPIPPPVR